MLNASIRRLVCTLLVSILCSLPAAGQQCSCQVVNRADVTQASGSCSLPGQGTVPCFTAQVGSIPGNAIPQSGTCAKNNGETWLCGPETKNCEYTSIRMVVVPTPCARTCIGAASTTPKLEATSMPAFTVHSGGPAVNVDVLPGNISAECGTPDTSRYVRYYNTKGAVILELRFTWGCHHCPAVASDG